MLYTIRPCIHSSKRRPSVGEAKRCALPFPWHINEFSLPDYTKRFDIQQIEAGVIKVAKELSSSARKVQDALAARGLACPVVELPASTRSAQEAAQAVGCHVGQIAKSLVFRGKHTNRAILVIASGLNRVNEKKLSGLVSEPVEKADADFVREKVGFVIGGVPPVTHVYHPDK